MRLELTTSPLLSIELIYICTENYVYTGPFLMIKSSITYPGETSATYETIVISHHCRGLFNYVTLISCSRLPCPIDPSSNNQEILRWMAGSVAHSCNPATGRPGEADDLRSGQLLDGHLRWTGVRTKPGVDMVNGEESSVSRSTKDGRIGSGGKLSSQKAARRCSSGIAPVSGWRSAARSIQSYIHLFISHEYPNYRD